MNARDDIVHKLLAESADDAPRKRAAVRRNGHRVIVVTGRTQEDVVTVELQNVPFAKEFADECEKRADLGLKALAIAQQAQRTMAERRAN